MSYTLANVGGGPCIACGTGKLRKSKGRHPVILCKNCGATWSTGGRLLRNPCYLIKGTLEEDWREPGVKKYRGRSERIRELHLPTIGSAHEVAKVAGLKSYAIADVEDSWGDKPVFKTKDIMEFEAASKIESETETQKIHLRVEQLKKTPRTIVLKKYPGRVVIYAKRGTPEYRPGYSRKIQMGASVHIKVPKKTARSFHLGEFITQAGTVQKKKFMDSWTYYFGGKEARRATRGYFAHGRRYIEGRPAEPGVYPPALKDIAEDLKMLNDKFKNIQKTIWNTSTYGMNPRRKR